MTVNRDLWKKWLLKDDFTQIPCPHCNQIRLNFEENGFKEIEKRSSVNYRKKGRGVQEDYEGVFSAILKCSKCFETLLVIGNSCYDVDYDSSNEPYFNMFYNPKYFHPVVDLFPLSEDIPKNVKTEVRIGFSLFWQDPSACGNRLRVAIENLLDGFKIPQFSKNDGLHRILLHNRIEEFRKRVPKYSGLTDKLIAIKWIGNDSSHSSELSRDDIFDALDILDFVFEEIYQGRRDKIKKLVARINKQKGIIKRKG